ncbi:S1C family serine protease [Streptomyces sp. enrichment culture]|uniref:S1C family serine protease n=1 Tax=Streptomyces sp. enrichment culture TaxID=1795815 RepID=UPI003F56AA2D
MTERSAAPQGNEGPQPYAGFRAGPACPPPPAHPPAYPPPAPPPHSYPLPADPPAHPPSAAAGHGRRRRAGRPVALVAAAALAAAALGGGAGALAHHLVGGAAADAPAPVTGTALAGPGTGTVAGVARDVSPSVVEIDAATGSGRSTGSGVVISADGEVVTNHHVVSGASEVRVRLADGAAYTADVVGGDPGTDLALLRLRGAKGLKAAVLGDSSRVRVGDQVVAIGSPGGLTGTVTSGIVSALDREVRVGGSGGPGGRGGAYGGTETPGTADGTAGGTTDGTTDGTAGGTADKAAYKAIQTDASLNPGNSGGALTDMRGEVIGINSALYAPSGATGPAAGSVGLGFAIPVNTLKARLDALRGA